MFQRKSLKLFTLSLSLFSCQTLWAQSVDSDQWSATDALARKVVEYPDAPAKRDKVVAMFYWTWHQGNDDTTTTVKNITEIVRNHPEAMKEIGRASGRERGNRSI